MLGRIEIVREGGGGGGGEKEFWNPNKINLTSLVSCKVSTDILSQTLRLFEKKKKLIVTNVSSYQALLISRM